MIKLFYEFNVDDAFRFASTQGIKAKEKGNEIMFDLCPYCKGGSSAKKDKGTFSINKNSGAFNCLRASCGVAGNMVTLSNDFDFSLGNQVDEYYKPKKQYRKLKQFKEPIKPKEPAIAYLESRGISEEVANKYEITTQSNNDNILVFPFFDEKGILQFIKYRKTDFDKAKDKNKEWCEANCKPILFGMKQCVDFTRLVICEGQVDSLSVSTAGIENCVSVPTGAKGFTWLPYCWDWINQFEEVVVFGDFENGTITLLDELSKRLKCVVKHVREEDYKDCKDANELLLKYGTDHVRSCVENAISIPVNHVIELADVEDINIYDIEKLPTGIHELDRLLYGGLPFGGVCLLSGKRGEGKSTLGSQILLSALDNGYCGMAYSGELPNSMFKSWFNLQAAGPRHLFEYQDRYGDTGYAVSKTNKQLIDNWHRGRMFMYDNKVINGDERESLLDIIEGVIMRNGVRVVLLDNLMTGIDLEVAYGSDKYERQSQFVKKLTRLALTHNVLIILIAHKRKNNFSQDENDEVSGSGDISNLATVVISYGKDKEIGEVERMLTCSKNRLFGKTNTKGWITKFDEKSKRIYGNGDNVNREYGWNTTDDGFMQLSDEEFEQMQI